MTGLAAWHVSANGLRVTSQDAFATARGDAFAATADNPSAIYYNPAGITQLDGTQLRAGLYSIYLEPAFRAPDSTPTHFVPNSGHTYDIEKHFAAIPQLFVTHTITNTPVSLGLGIYAPYGGSISWPDDTGFRAVATKGSVTYLRFNPVVAIKLTDTFSIAGGLMMDHARVHLEQGLRPFAAPVNYFRFVGEGWAIGANVGVLFQPSEQFSFGATFRSRTDFSLDGTTTLEQDPFIRETHIGASTSMEFPTTYAFGASYRPTPKWNVEVDADYTDWSAFNTINIHQNSAPPPPLQNDVNVPVNFGWQNSWNVSAGCTRYFDSGWHISGGLTYSENSVPDTYYTPLAADLDRYFFDFGVGRNGKHVDFDVTYQFGYGPWHSVTGSKPSSTPGITAGENGDGYYSFISHAIMVSATLHF